MRRSGAAMLVLGLLVSTAVLHAALCGAQQQRYQMESRWCPEHEGRGETPITCDRPERCPDSRVLWVGGDLEGRPRRVSTCGDGLVCCLPPPTAARVLHAHMKRFVPGDHGLVTDLGNNDLHNAVNPLALSGSSRRAAHARAWGGARGGAWGGAERRPGLPSRQAAYFPEASAAAPWRPSQGQQFESRQLEYRHFERQLPGRQHLGPAEHGQVVAPQQSLEPQRWAAPGLQQPPAWQRAFAGQSAAQERLFWQNEYRPQPQGQPDAFLQRPHATLPDAQWDGVAVSSAHAQRGFTSWQQATSRQSTVQQDNPSIAEHQDLPYTQRGYPQLPRQEQSNTWQDYSHPQRLHSHPQQYHSNPQQVPSYLQQPYSQPSLDYSTPQQVHSHQQDHPDSQQDRSAASLPVGHSPSVPPPWGAPPGAHHSVHGQGAAREPWTTTSSPPEAPTPSQQQHYSEPQPSGPTPEGRARLQAPNPGARSRQMCERYSRATRKQLQANSLLLSGDDGDDLAHVEDCSNPISLVVGGQNASQNEFPHMAAVGFRSGGELGWLCGGSLISDQFVLTAAHCTHTGWGSPVVVRVGTPFLASAPPSARAAMDAAVKEVVPHPQYAPPARYHDVALLRLDAALPLSERVRPACLPPPSADLHLDDLPAESLVVATGWGRLSYAGDASDVLQKVPLRVWARSSCARAFQPDGANGLGQRHRLQHGLGPGMLCAGDPHSNKDTCQGDSGGPLQRVTPENPCAFEVVGITSFGKECGLGLPAVYTKVSFYVAWIEDVVWPQ